MGQQEMKTSVTTRTCPVTIVLLAMALSGGAREQAGTDAAAQRAPVQGATVRQAIVQRTPLRTLPTYRLEGFMDQALGDLGGKRINDLIEASNVVKAVVLRNNTSMPDDGHLAGIFGVLHDNPQIRPLWEKDERTGALRRSGKFDSSRAFFAVLFVTAGEEFVGFLVNRDAVRIVTKDGDGYVSRK